MKTYLNRIRLNCDDGITFGDASTELRFGASGELVSVTLSGETFAMSGREIAMTMGGYYKSSIDLENLNKNWAALRGEDMEHLSPESKYISHRVVTSHNTASLHLTVQLGSVTLTKIYTLEPDIPGYSLRFEAYGTGMLRSVTAAFPQVDGWDVCNLNRVGTAGFSVKPGGEKTLAVWCDPRFEAASVSRELAYQIRCERALSEDAVSFGDVHYTLVDGGALAAADHVREALELVGLRANNRSTALLKSLAIYETHIGPLRLSETKCHEGYAHPQDLADDLPRIRDLGFNCIELMPSFLFPCYTVFDLKNPDLQHGAGESIRPIIERAHALGMRVILDVLLHGCIDVEIADWDRERYCSRRYYWPEWQKRIPEFHEGRVSPLRAEHPDWFIYEKPGEIFRGYTWTFDHASAGFRQYLREAMEISVRDWHVDGFRFDAPTWQCGVNSAENLPYSGADSLAYGHWRMFRECRHAVEKIRDDLIWMVESPYYQYTDSCDMSYSYDLYHGYFNSIFEGKQTARGLQEFMQMKQSLFPTGAMYVNFADNHDTWNNGVTEDGLYMHERTSMAYAKAIFAVAAFANGALQCYAGCEFSSDEYAQFMRETLAWRRELAPFMARSRFDASAYADDARVLSLAYRAPEKSVMFAANLSGDTMTCSIPGAGTLTLGAYETRVIQ